MTDSNEIVTLIGSGLSRTRLSNPDNGRAPRKPRAFANEKDQVSARKRAGIGESGKSS